MSATRPVALVTGAYSGLGKFAALGLVEAGFEVVGTSRNTDGLVRREGVTFFDLDVTSDDSVTLLIKRVLAQFGRIDVLVNNAGMGASCSSTSAADG
jgi:NAD(P)-dependent dehydrogenase (short-subunit alcohol dehydrogenase family)